MSRGIHLNFICFILSLLFTYAAVSKLLDIQKFQVELSKSPMLTIAAVPLSYGVPLTEISLSIVIFIPAFRLVGLYACYSLMTIFTAYIVIIMNYSYYIPCSCGGILQKLGWKEHLVFNVVFVLIILVGIVMEEKYRPKEVSRQLP